MSSETTRKAALEKAEQQEQAYAWLEAADSLKHALTREPEADSFDAEVFERIGFCYVQASRQAGTFEEFKKLRELAIQAYKSAVKLFKTGGQEKNQGKIWQCHTLTKYAYSWLALNPSEKREALDECIESGKKSLEAYKRVDDEVNYGKMCNNLLTCLLERLYVASDLEEMQNVAQEGIDCACKAVEVLSKVGDKTELLRAYFTASLQGWYAAHITEQEGKRKELAQRSLGYSQEALKLSEEIENPYYTAMANWAAAFCTLLFTEKVESSLRYANEMFRQATMVRDNYLKGVASYVLAFVTNWMMLREGDPDKKKEGLEKIIQYAEDARQCLQPVSQDFFIAEAYLYYADSYSSLTREVETDPKEKLAMLEKAVAIGREGLEHALRSGSPDATGSTLHALSKALHFYSGLQTGVKEKARLLEEALTHREEYNKIAEKVFASNDWVLGVGKNYEGLIEADLAMIEGDKNKRKLLLESAVVDMEKGLSHCRKWILSRPVPTTIVAVARFEDGFGGILSELYLSTEDRKVLSKAVEAYESAARDFMKVSLPSRVAESYWKIAVNQDRLDKHQKAAENFENAFVAYKDAAQKTPNFADFYLDYATYMKAWSEIEEAKSAHEREDYVGAMKCYEKIAGLLGSSRLWSYLSTNFLAWAILEQAEDHSRKEYGVESIEAFNNAADLFKKAKEAFEIEIDRIQSQDEKEKASQLCKASLQRRDYCLARVNLEEARMHDRKGNYSESAEEYDSAADIFEKIIDTLEAEADRKEIETIAYMCRAWQKMKMADRRASAELYGEASELFLKAKEHSIKDKTTLLALGNSAFCKALEHGTKFEATKEKDDFSKAKQYLGSAANYYLKAGFDNASVWTNATELLFDAYNYMKNAETEVDSERKMKAYLLTEKCLERSAELYETARYVGKRDEVQKTLERVKEKRGFELSLGDLLAAPSDISGTTAISAPRLTVEEPVGLLKFERAFVQANLIAPKREVVVGENVNLEIQLANLGKNMAFLVRIEDIVPKDFDLPEKPERCVLENGFLNLKAKRLAPLESLELKLKLKPKKKGKFVFNPKIQYLDEGGEQKFCELGQIAVTVKELGIRGWLKGPD
jgi:hypothetical protein